MARNGTPHPQPLQIHRLPQSKYIDALRWLPPISPFDRHVVLAAFNSDSDASSVEIHSINSKNPSETLTHHFSWTSPHRISSLKVSQTPQKPVIAASSFSGSFHVLFADSLDATIDSEVSLPENALHAGPISGIDLNESGSECVTVGMDGRVNVVSVGGSGVSYRKVFDSNGLASYTATKWASPAEFATGGPGLGVQWWDQRKCGGPAAQFKGNWAQKTSGIVHSIDIHPSRKHTCLAGGSSGSVFAWDLRWQQQPIILSGVGMGETPAQSLSESEVWEVQYDTFTRAANLASISSTRVLPAMICSEDGILAVVEQGEEAIEFLAEPCAINSFDIDKQNPSDVICSLEWESIAVLSRA
ncbi:hypothetical protein RJ640_017719 [Escallonia rubra]|uniref:Nuclear pore complex protein NUP43 n=1 Tax=Escallonia rubra TaxID=112253 RepID=A0AA88S8A1_9ASTE|nr:hypothetical protein RJ640_017719 [Escallonia rubra]